MAKVFQALSEDIAMAAGGPMGSLIVENWRRYFSTMKKAKAACEKDYHKHPDRDKIKWSRGTRGSRSGDLGHVMYTILQLKVE